MTVTQIIPFSYQDHQIRIVQVESESYFIGKDVCDALGLVRTNSAMRKLDDDEKLMRKIYASGQTRDVWLVNESGLYHLIFRSNKPEARAFRKWVTNEVLPSIRRRGYYTPQQPTGTQLALFEQDSPPTRADQTGDAQTRDQCRTSQPLGSFPAFDRTCGIRKILQRMTITYYDEDDRKCVAIYSGLSPEEVLRLQKGIPAITRALIRIDISEETRESLSLLLQLQQAMLCRDDSTNT